MAVRPNPLAERTRPPKVAIIHDWLDRRVGGAERVLLKLASLYPDADIYTLVFDASAYKDKLDPARVRTSWLNRLPRRLKSRPKLLLPAIKNAIESLDLSAYDIVISSSGAWSKNVITPARTLHICYCHSPARFLWDYRDQYLAELSQHSSYRRLARGLRWLVAWQISRLRRWDYLASRRPDILLANSRHVAGRIERYLDRTSRVLHPPVDIDGAKPTAKKGDYYVTLGTLTPYKKLDLVIRAFNDSGRKLVVIGDGPERPRLEKLAGRNIEFAGRIDEAGKWQLLSRARGLVIANEEDFGIAPVEALASGTPVIAYRRGGVAETIEDTVTGVLFDEQTPAAINAAVKRTDNLNPDSQLLSRAQTYSTAEFERQFMELVDREYRRHQEQLPAMTHQVLGVPINVVNMSDTLALINSYIHGEKLQQLATVNAEFVMLAQRDPKFRTILERCALRVADGVGVLWALYWRDLPTRNLRSWLAGIARIVLHPKALRTPLAERVSGVDLVEKLAEHAAERGWRLYLLGAAHGVAQEAARRLQARWPALIIAGSESGSPDTSQDEAIIRRINDSSADILLVAYGPPKQERWIARNGDRLSTVKVAFGVGGTFDYLSGGVWRAPKVLQTIGLEWLWRLILQPKRIRRQLAIPIFLYEVYKTRHK